MTTSLRPIRKSGERVLSPSECYWCGASPKPPDEMIAYPGNPMHQSFLLGLRRPCCHAQVSTEHFGTVLDYLCDGWARAQLICRLYNTHVGLPAKPDAPRPDWPERRAMEDRHRRATR